MNRRKPERRILSVWWPRLAIERWAKASGAAPDACAEPSRTAVVLTIEAAHGPVIHALTQAAAERGAQSGQRLTDARALDPGLVAIPADPDGDEALVRRLAHWAQRWSRLVEVDGPDGLRLDVSGAAHLFGGEKGLVADVEKRFAAMGLTVRTAIAPTASAAWALARFGLKPSPLEGEGYEALATKELRRSWVRGSDAGVFSSRRRGSDPSPYPLPQGEREWATLLAPLPVAALRLPAQAVRTLERLGLKTIGALSGIERRSLARRFRDKDNPVDALDRMLGRKPEPLTGTRDAPPPRAALRLAEPAADPALLPQVLARLAERLAREMARRRLGARQIAFEAWRVDGEVGEAVAETALPTRDPGHFVRLLREKLERLDPGFGFDAFALTARRCEPLDPAQAALIGECPSELELARLVDRLVSRLGSEAVRRPCARESHVPERASGWRSAVNHPLPVAGGASRKAAGEGLSALHRPSPALLRSACPSREREGRIGPQRLLDRPEAIAVVYATPEGLPRRFVWRRAVHDIARVEGPERIAPEWWRERSTARLRDYYRVEDGEGRRYWIYREGVIGDGRGGIPAWYLHGLFG